MKNNNQKGFTLVELIIVIVILGILAVTASPKLLDIQGDAKESTLDALAASLKGAQQIVYSKALIQGKTGATGTVTPSIDVIYGYPKATASVMNTILDLDYAVADKLTTNGNSNEWEIKEVAAVGTAGASVRIYPNGTYDNATDASDKCYVEYIEASGDTSSPVVVTPPSVKVETGC